MELSFCKLRGKDVVNICDGKNLGNITDIIFDCSCGRIIGLVIPAQKNFFSFFKSNNDIFIPYNRICKIGKDIILVDIIMQQNCECETNNCFHDCTCRVQEQPKNINIQSMLDDINNSK